MATPIKFGTSGWRSIVADEFTIANIRRAVAGIAAVSIHMAAVAQIRCSMCCAFVFFAAMILLISPSFLQ